MCEIFLVCVGVALVLGVLISLVHSFKSRYSKSFLMTVAVLPAAVCVVIMMVNGNIGAGVAVAGAFSLVRFRSAPGSAREIATIFLSMGAGLVCGMGYIAYAVLFTVIMGVFMVLISAIGFGDRHRATVEKTLKITIPEDLEFSGLFDDIFEKYTKSHVQTSGMAQNFGTSSTQGSILVNIGSSSGEVLLLDESGKTLASFIPQKNYQCVLITSPSIVEGETYTIKTNSGEQTVTMTGLIYGETHGMGGFGGGMGRPDGGGRPPKW